MLTRKEKNRVLHDLQRISYTIKGAMTNLQSIQNDLKILRLECDRLYEDLGEKPEKKERK